MSAERTAYAVFLHPQAIEVLGPAIQPYLSESPAGPHLACAEIDAGGALFEMTLLGRDAEGRMIEVDLMVPSGMVRLVVSIRREGDFGFGPREAPTPGAPIVPDTSAPADATPPPTPPPSTVAPGAAKQS
jgi:hypothetical protein